jgi:hypothetical protein
MRYIANARVMRLTSTICRLLAREKPGLLVSPRSACHADVLLEMPEFGLTNGELLNRLRSNVFFSTIALHLICFSFGFRVSGSLSQLVRRRAGCVEQLV